MLNFINNNSFYLFIIYVEYNIKNLKQNHIIK